MSCCPPIPQVVRGSESDEDIPAQDTDIRPGETVECYMNRSGNTTGKMDDKTEPIPDKVENNDIPLQGGVKVDVQFLLTANSTRTATSWKVGGDAMPGITFTTAGKMTGTFADAQLGKTFKITVTASDAAGDIDTRGFAFAPSKSTGMNEISFTHPLPGARVTSMFGPRRPPATGASSQHGGVDFSVKPLPPAEVLAAADGEVVFTGFQAGGAGNYIKIRHKNSLGKEMCQTVYMHLADIYVKSGQTVVSGQKIGREGNTGIGTGPHLHFECRLPNGTKIDPLPLIRGSMQVSRLTNPDNSAVESSIITQNPGGSLTPENVQAKESQCAAFGTDYPKDPTATDDNPPTDLTDPFEQAWFFTMTHEVGPHWTTASPDDPETAAGLCSTQAQKKKTGYVNTPNFPGGDTKFGIAQGPNPSINVLTMAYSPAKKTGYNNYWKRGAEQLRATKPKSAVMVFDMNYLHGVGNANSIRRNANIDSMDDAQACIALQAAQEAFMKNIVAKNPGRLKYLNGWLKRSRELLRYAQGVQ